MLSYDHFLLHPLQTAALHTLQCPTLAEQFPFPAFLCSPKRPDRMWGPPSLLFSGYIVSFLWG
jgi:hypothetical protein